MPKSRCTAIRITYPVRNLLAEALQYALPHATKSFFGTGQHRLELLRNGTRVTGVMLASFNRWNEQ